MKPLLVIWLPPAEEEITWLRVDPAQRRVEARGSVTGLGDLPEGATAASPAVWLVVPGEHVIAALVSLPVEVEAKARAAAPFALEDQLAEDYSVLHFALGPRRADGSRLSYRINTPLVTEWLEESRKTGLSIGGIVPDFALCAPEGDDVTLWHIGDRIIAGAGGGIGASAEADLWPSIIAALQPDGGKGRVTLHTERPATFAQLCDAMAERVEFAASATPDELTESGSLALASSEPINLLQGALRPRQPWAEKWPVWRTAAALLLVAGVGYLALVYSQALRLEAAADRMTAATEQAFQVAFPGEKLVNPRAQIRARLDQSGDSGSQNFLQLMALLHKGVETVPGVRLVSARYEAADGTLSAELAHPSYAEIEQVKANITALGGELSEGEARQQDGYILGNVTVRKP